MKKKILLVSLGSVLALSTVAASVILLNNKSANTLEGTDVTYSITINADDVSNSASYESKTVELKTDQLENPINFTFTNIRRSGDYLEFKGSGDGTFGNADSSAIYAIKHIDIYSYEDNDPNIVKIQWGWKVDSTVEYPYHAYIYNEYPDGMIYRFEEDRPDYFKIVNDDGEGKSVKIKKMIVTYGSECETKTSYGDPYRTINKLKYKKDVLEKNNCVSLHDAKEKYGKVNVAGIISYIKTIKVKKNNTTMAFVKIFDESDELELTVFARTYEASFNLLTKNNIILVKGRYEHNKDKESFVADEISLLEDK